ncbi:hypothetical protein KVT40_002449 [Elsinoe batatas]|uniref:Uncharacterized protein n=1 Tax=Elsinoe batatas TaxID=2601811 RepID=A0A8K0L8N8_9PEZI|nr:hypothetical protein KVT40_002449 [Elsinoe batatas]
MCIVELRIAQSYTKCDHRTVAWDTFPMDDECAEATRTGQLCSEPILRLTEDKIDGVCPRCQKEAEKKHERRANGDTSNDKDPDPPSESQPVDEDEWIFYT